MTIDSATMTTTQLKLTPPLGLDTTKLMTTTDSSSKTGAPESERCALSPADLPDEKVETNLKCAECSSLLSTGVTNMALRPSRYGDPNDTHAMFLNIGVTHNIGAQHHHPFEHTFFQYGGKGAVRRTAQNHAARRRTFLCLHLDCLNFISPGCMYCETCKKICTKCRTQPRANRSTKLCYACQGRAPITEDLKIESNVFKNGKRLIHPTRYKKGRCETCGPRVTFHNFRDSSEDIWVSKNKECAVCWARTHPEEVMDWTTVSDEAQYT